LGVIAEDEEEEEKLGLEERKSEPGSPSAVNILE